ncbi:hypothetical protein G6F37_006945 [Rhizopus arrhizus]|nr:hypothetical protein G6F38_002357 [Rhizopus arrhizus]KAG1157163.1 hypothetical protein G6F37_006945 [Rhizopus arrhizus]
MGIISESMSKEHVNRIKLLADQPEIEISELLEITGAVKWNGICFPIKHRRLTPVIIEFSESAKFNRTTAKEEGDEEKMI